MSRFLALLALIFTIALAVNAKPGSLRAAPKARAAHNVIQARQLNRVKLEAIKARQALRKKGVLRPRASAVNYPKCSSATTAGYAHFPNYDYLGSDISNAVAAGSEAACLDMCKLNSACLGIFWWPENGNTPCFLKNTDRSNTALNNQGVSTAPAAAAGAGASLQGSCAEVASYFDASKMAVCCDTIDAYPVCATGLTQYARFPQRDYLGADMAGNPVTITTEQACEQLCNNTANCQAVFWWPQYNRCYLKTSNNDTSIYSSTSVAAQAAGSVFDARGTTCNILASQGVPSSAMQVCCNSS